MQKNKQKTKRKRKKQTKTKDERGKNPKQIVIFNNH